MTYTVKRNRTSVHIDGLNIRTQNAGDAKDGVVGYYAQNACPTITRSRLAAVKSFDTVEEAVAHAELTARISNVKFCKHCQKAAAQ